MDVFETRIIDCQQSACEYAITGVVDKEAVRLKTQEPTRTILGEQQQAIYAHSVKDEIVRIDNLYAPNLEELIITRNIREIGCNACRGLDSLRKVVFESADILIEDYAFWNNKSLVDVEIPDDLLPYYPAFKGCPVYETLLSRYRAWADRMEIVPKKALPRTSNLFGAFSGCKNIKAVDIGRKKFLSRHLDLTTAFAESGIEVALVPADAEKLMGAFTGCQRLETILVDGAHRYPECGDAFGYTHAREVKSVFFSSEEPSIIGSTPGAVWYVPHGSGEAYRKAVVEYNNSDQAAMLGHYIYCKGIVESDPSINISEIDLNNLLK